MLVGPVSKMSRGERATSPTKVYATDYHPMKPPREERWKNPAASTGRFCRNEQFRRDTPRILGTGEHEEAYSFASYLQTLWKNKGRRRELELDIGLPMMLRQSSS